MFKRRETILFAILTTGIVTLNLLELNQLDFLLGLSRIFLYFLFLCALLYCLYRLIKDRREVSIFEKIKPLLLGIALASFFYFLSFLVDTDGGKKRILTAAVDNDINFIHFQLFGDNIFKLLNSGPFGGPIYRGSYTLIKDTLRFNNDSLRNLYPTLTLALKENANKRKYFEPVDTSKFKYVLYIQKDYRLGNKSAAKLSL